MLTGYITFIRIAAQEIEVFFQSKTMQILSETPVEGKPGYMGTSILSKYAV